MYDNWSVVRSVSKLFHCNCRQLRLSCLRKSELVYQLFHLFMLLECLFSMLDNYPSTSALESSDDTGGSAVMDGGDELSPAQPPLFVEYSTSCPDCSDYIFASDLILYFKGFDISISAAPIYLTADHGTVCSQLSLRRSLPWKQEGSHVNNKINDVFLSALPAFHLPDQRVAVILGSTKPVRIRCQEFPSVISTGTCSAGAKLNTAHAME